MNPDSDINDHLEISDDVVADEGSSVDDFIKELEAKEKDLHITADLRIEIADDIDGLDRVPDYIAEDLAGVKPGRPSADGVASAATKARNYELEKEISELKVRVLELKAERREMQEKNDRRLKDFENFKYRVDRERRGAFIEQIGNLASQMLPVLDNMNRALDAADEIVDERSPEFKQFFDGIVLVNQQMAEVFAGMGVQPIATVGETFDPNFHEAVATEERNDLPPNTVSEEMLRGYRIGNKVIRHSMVRVTSAPVVAAKETAPAPADEAPDETADGE